MQPEPLWEKFVSWSVYQYGMNNPLVLVDRDGDPAIYVDLIVDENTEKGQIKEMLRILRRAAMVGIMECSDVPLIISEFLQKKNVGKYEYFVHPETLRGVHRIS